MIRAELMDNTKDTSLYPPIELLPIKSEGSGGGRDFRGPEHVTAESMSSRREGRVPGPHPLT